MRTILTITQMVFVEPSDNWEVTTKDGRSFTASIESVDDEGSIILKMADNKVKAYAILNLLSFQREAVLLEAATLRRLPEGICFVSYLEADGVRYMSAIPVQSEWRK